MTTRIGIASWVAMALLVVGCTRAPGRDASNGAPADSAPHGGAAAWIATRAGRIESVRVALGNEPFWNVEVSPESLIYRTPEHLDGIAFARVPGAKPSGIRNGSPSRLELEFAPDSCSDGMSDRVYPMRATARLDTVELHGCAEDRSVWYDEGAGFRFAIPLTWDRNWYAVVHERAPATDVPGMVWADFRLRPSATAAPGLLLRIARLDRLYWDRLRRAPAPGDTLVGAGDEVVAEHAGDVWVAHLPRASAAAPGTPAAERFERARLDLDRVRRSFTLAVPH